MGVTITHFDMQTTGERDPCRGYICTACLHEPVTDEWQREFESPGMKAEFGVHPPGVAYKITDDRWGIRFECDERTSKARQEFLAGIVKRTNDRIEGFA